MASLAVSGLTERREKGRRVALLRSAVDVTGASPASARCGGLHGSMSPVYFPAAGCAAWGLAAATALGRRIACRTFHGPFGTPVGDARRGRYVLVDRIVGRVISNIQYVTGVLICWEFVSNARADASRMDALMGGRERACGQQEGIGLWREWPRQGLPWQGAAAGKIAAVRA
jgi:hypothetical protein